MPARRRQGVVPKIKRKSKVGNGRSRRHEAAAATWAGGRSRINTDHSPCMLLGCCMEHSARS